ncbi:MAG: hypothetical protein JWR63_3325 [Conexibacter sp.]|nr:hypothetical protein [Conexibacter sp.]
MERGVIVLIGFFALVAAFYAWIIGTSIEGFDHNPAYGGAYGHLADAFVHGQLNLRVSPPDGLLALPDPYDPAANDPFRGQGFQDLILYNGKVYIYWGPVPALLLFVPLQLLGGFMVEGLATLLVCFGGFVFSVLTLRFLARRFLPRTPGWALWAGMIALAVCNVVPFILRRAGHSEVAIGSGLCFGFLAIWLFVTGWYGDQVSARRLAGASLALGLAIGSRMSWVVLAVVPVAVVLWLWRADRRADRARLTAALLGPLAACGSLLMLYNLARFGSPVELGAKYQLAGVNQAEYAPFTFGFLKPGLFYYLLEPPRLEPLFPFVALGPPPLYPGDLPHGYIRAEPTAGLLPTTPFLLILALLPAAWRRWEPRLRRIVLTVAALGLGILALTAGALWSTTERYVVDFMTFLLVAALLVWFTALSSERRRPRRIAAVAGGAALSWSVLYAVAVSFIGYGMPMAITKPSSWARLESAFSPISRIVAGMAGRPVIGRIAPVPFPAPVVKGWGSLRREPVEIAQEFKPTTLRVASAHKGTFLLHATVQPGPDVVPGAGVDMQVATQRGQAHAIVRGGLSRVVLPVRLDGGVTTVTVTVQAQRAVGRRLLAITDMAFDKP